LRAIEGWKGLARRLGLARVAGALRTARVLRKDPLEVWKGGLESEIRFWERVLPGRVVSDPDFRQRADPAAPVSDPLLKLLIARLPEPTLSLIDVGAGPLTALGKTYPGRVLRITATDPLAEEFLRILRGAGIEPPVPPIACRGEDLVERFEPSTFDIAYARNALDHCADPLRVIANMVALVKPGRYVVLRHFCREAERHGYRGLHQWNFDVEDGDLALWRSSRERIGVRQALCDAAALECSREGAWVVTVLTRKRKD